MRKKRAASDPAFSLRKVAGRLDIEPSYLSKIESAHVPPSDDTIHAIAKEFGEDVDVLTLLAGKGRIFDDFFAEARKHPHTFVEFLRQIKHIPPGAIIRLVREVRDGKW